MTGSIQWNESILVAGECDVLVCGGGIAGVAAALAAARMGKKVILLEKNTALGGLATIGLINFWVPMCNRRGKWVIRGMAEELLRLSIKYGYDSLPDDWKELPYETDTRKALMSGYSVGGFALSMLKLLRDEGVTIFYDALVSVPVMKGKHCEGIIIDGKSGRQFYKAGVVVDATGDADVLKRAGVPTVDGYNYFTMSAMGVDLAHCAMAVEKQDIRYAYAGFSGGVSSLYGQGHPEGMPRFKGASLEVINDFLQLNQLEMLKKIKDQPRKERDVLYLPAVPQLRTSRHLVGDEPLTMKHLYTHSERSIGAICDFDNSDRLFEVPYGSLVQTGYDNLITCGRCAAAEGWAWDVLRVIPPAVLTGQASGIAAALSLDMSKPIWDIPVKPLQTELAKSGVLIHYPDEWMPDEPETVERTEFAADHLE